MSQAAAPATPTPERGALDRLLPQLAGRRGTSIQQSGAERTELGRAQFPNLQSDVSHRLTVVADGPEIQVYLNGQSVLTARDDAFPAGLIGLATGVGNPSGEARIAFEGLRVVNLR